MGFYTRYKPGKLHIIAIELAHKIKTTRNGIATAGFDFCVRLFLFYLYLYNWLVF
jgi:hypothetical protein